MEKNVPSQTLFPKDRNKTVNFSGKLFTSLRKLARSFFFFLSLIFKVSLKHQDVGPQPTGKSFLDAACLLSSDGGVEPCFEFSGCVSTPRVPAVAPES